MNEKKYRNIDEMLENVDIDNLENSAKVFVCHDLTVFVTDGLPLIEKVNQNIEYMGTVEEFLY